MKKTNFIFLLTLIFSYAGIVNAQTFSGGTGIESDPYLIATTDHMQSMHSVSYANPVYFKMVADVDMNGISWTPLNVVSPYAKVIHFDGNGHLIKNLTISGSVRYSSLFGILRGSCKNLGVVNASVTIAESGVGIIAGYAGLKAPSDASFTGMIENCFTSGTVSGTDGVGGIVGNIGKPFGTTNYSGVKNSYSTANVKATNTTASSRAGGIVGINYAGGVIENCHTTGTIISKGTKGAGGIAGWTDTDIVGCVSLNDSVINELSGNLGRIAANMGLSGVIAQGVNCWASEVVVVNNAGVIRDEQDMFTGTVTVRDTPYDGETKTSAFLSDFSNFETVLGWNFTGANKIWSTNTGTGYPMHQWYVDNLTSSTLNQRNSDTKLYIQNGTLILKSTKNIGMVNIYDLTGSIVYTKQINTNNTAIKLPLKGMYLVTVDQNASRLTTKIII